MKDIILLALSTLSAEKKEAVFIVPGDSHTFTYTGQMEPIVQYKLYQKPENDIVIIALCTGATRTNKNNFASCTALDYFESRIKEIKE